jgi:hypothetical protein
MHKERNNFFVLILTVVLFLLSNANAERILTEKEVEQQFKERIGGILPNDKFRIAFNEEKLKHKQIQLFGKVIDQFGKPIPDANLIIQIATMYVEGGIKTVTCITDINGLFVLNDIGTDVLVTELQKEGYEFNLENNLVRSFNYDPSSGICYIPNINKPVIFYMRKMGPKAFLISEELSIRLMAAKNEYLVTRDIDLLGTQLNGFIDGNSIWHDFEEHIDVHIKAELFEDPNAYKISFKALDPNCGFTVSNELLYEAPSEGYVPEIVFEGNITEDMKEMTTKYIYIKARNGQIYSRLDFNVRIRNKKEPGPVVLCGGHFLSNPASSRYLELYEDYNINETERRMNIQKQTKEKERQEKMNVQR